MRNPAINELYSRGLHQGVGGIEEGDINLEMEKAIKNTLSYKYLPNEKFSFEALAFAQYFQNYIYLNPEDKVRLTIRGAFPLFSYKQTSALIYGVDLSTTLTFAKSFYSRLNYSFIRGKDTGINAPLVFIPPNSFFGSFSYRMKNGSTASIIEDIEFEVSNRYVFRQNYLNADQDFVAPPPGYNLLGAKISANISSSKVGYRLFVQVENLLNASYRDYLNRQRYFADDLGISFTLGAQLKF
jgi:iron complex outermembrane receptor protein